MGGTFDPIHIGHLAAASEVMGELDLDEVVFVPAGEPHHKAGTCVTAAEDRLTMVELAVAANPRFTTSRVDVDRPGPTYTVDTLKDIRAERGPDVDLTFITGADALASILSWHGAEELFDLAHFVGVTRPGFEVTTKGLPQDRVTTLTIPALAMSSSEIRARVAADRPVWYWLPDPVLGFVGKKRLYGASWSSVGR
jgi:nicotinate-nucleotide adenylyltransferase